MIRMRHPDENSGEISDINVTPFIDVVLVLLIIFMITAPLTTVKIPVTLPSSSSKNIEQPHHPVYLTLKTDHSLQLGEQTIQKEQLASAINTATKGNKNEPIFLYADTKIDYGSFIEIIDQLRIAGYFKISLVNLQKKATTP